jgi:hypothetical protein
MGATNGPGHGHAGAAAIPTAGRCVRGDACPAPAAHRRRRPGASPSTWSASSAVGWSPAGTDDPGVLPVDVSFGDSEPLLPAALSGSAARALLERHIASFVLDAQHVLQLRGRNERLAKSASTDLLTGLANRRTLDRALGRLAADDTVILLDLDHFKQVNDNFGHAAGDEVLRVFGSVLRGTVRGRDTAGRFGGDEFLIVLAPQRARTSCSGGCVPNG